MIGSAVEPFVGADVAYCYALSKTMTGALAGYFRRLHDLRENPRLAVIESEDPYDPASNPKKTHAGIVIDYDAENVVLLERHAEVNGKHYVIYDEESEEAFRNVGAKYGVARAALAERRVSLHHKRVRLLTEQEVLKWRVEKLHHHDRHLTLRAPAGATAESVAPVFAATCPDVCDAKVASVWSDGSGSRKVTIAFSIFGDRVPEKAMAQIRRTGEALGWLS